MDKVIWKEDEGDYVKKVLVNQQLRMNSLLTPINAA